MNCHDFLTWYSKPLRDWIPSGKHTKNYGKKSSFLRDVNQLCPCSIAFCMVYQRVIQNMSESKKNIQLHKPGQLIVLIRLCLCGRTKTTMWGPISVVLVGIVNPSSRCVRCKSESLILMQWTYLLMLYSDKQCWTPLHFVHVLQNLVRQLHSMAQCYSMAQCCMTHLSSVVSWDMFPKNRELCNRYPNKQRNQVVGASRAFLKRWGDIASAPQIKSHEVLLGRASEDSKVVNNPFKFKSTNFTYITENYKCSFHLWFASWRWWLPTCEFIPQTPNSWVLRNGQFLHPLQSDPVEWRSSFHSLGHPWRSEEEIEIGALAWKFRWEIVESTGCRHARKIDKKSTNSPFKRQKAPFSNKTSAQKKAVDGCQLVSATCMWT